MHPDTFKSFDTITSYSNYPCPPPSADSRPAMNQEQFDNLYGYQRPTRKFGVVTRNALRVTKRYWKPFTSCDLFLAKTLSFFPILKWLPQYQWKDWLAGDIISGITLAVLHVPKGIVNASLARVQPVFGLYTSLFPVLLYMIFGTSMHNSLGSVALTSMMAGNSVLRICGEIPVVFEKHDVNLTFIPSVEDSTTVVGVSPVEDYNQCSLQVVTTLAFVVGLIHILMGFLQLEILATYLSDQLISGFNLASGFHVVISQLPSLFGIQGLPEHAGFCHLFLDLYHTLLNVPRANLIASVFGIAAVIFLVIGKDHVDTFLKKKYSIQVPVPFDLILIVVMIVVSYFAQLNQKYDIKVVAESPSGLPTPHLPRLDKIGVLFFDALSIALVVVANHISLVKMFGKKQDFKLDYGQEFYALGLSTSLSSFLPVFPPCSALGRTMVIVKTGNRTQLSGLFCSVCLVLVIAFAGAWLAHLPMCVLAAATIVSQKSMLKKFKDPSTLWPISKIDFSIWLVAFAATISWDVTYGLAVAVVYSLLTPILRLQFPRYRTLGVLDGGSSCGSGSSSYDDLERYKHAADHKDVFIFRFDAPLLFTNVAKFRQSISKSFDKWQHQQISIKESVDSTIQEKPRQPLKFSLSLPEELSNSSIHSLASLYSINKVLPEKPEAGILYKHLIIDCSGFTFVDYMGVNALKEVFSEMREQKVLVYFAAAKAPVRDLFEASGFYKYVPKSNFYPTIRDAVATARKRRNDCSFYHIDDKSSISDTLTTVVSS